MRLGEAIAGALAGRFPDVAAILLAESPLEEGEDQKIAPQNATGQEGVQRHTSRSYGIEDRREGFGKS